MNESFSNVYPDFIQRSPKIHTRGVESFCKGKETTLSGATLFLARKCQTSLSSI